MKRFLIAVLCLVSLSSYSQGSDASQSGSAVLRIKFRNTRVYLITSIYKGKEPIYEIEAPNEYSSTQTIQGYKCVGNQFSFEELTQLDTSGLSMFEAVQQSFLMYMQSVIGSKGQSAERAQLGALTAQVMAYNNAEMVNKLTDLMNSCIGEMPDITAEDLKKLDDINTKIKDIQNKMNETKEQINPNMEDVADLKSECRVLSGDVIELKRRIENSSSKEEVSALSSQIDMKMAELSNKMLTASSVQSMIDEVMNQRPYGTVGISGGDVGFSNMVAEVSLYLGADKADMTNSLAFTPPKLRAKRQDEGEEESEEGSDGGEVAENIIAYLNSYGVVAFDDGEGEGENGFDHLFGASVSGGTTNITANFNAPANWVDGATIQLTNGQYTVVGGSGAWWYDNVSQAFKDCSVQIGSHSINNASIPYSTAGNVYALITYGGSGTPTITLHSTDSYVDGVSISVWVGTLIPSPNGEGVVAQRWRGNGIVIFCYE